MKRFLGVYGIRIVIGAILMAALFAVLLVWMPYRREQRIASEFESRGAKVNWGYRGPNWMPQSSRSRTPFFRRVTSVDLNAQVIPPATLSGLTTLAHLKHFYAGKTPFDASSLEYLKGKSELTHLFLLYTNVSDASLENLASMQQLSILELDGTPIGDAGMEHLEGLTNLDMLFLINTKVTDSGLVHLTKLKNLRRLDLAETETTSEGRAKLRVTLPNCKITPDP